MNQPSSSQWDLGRFVKTMSYFGAVPILSQFDWFQSWFGHQPNPTVNLTAIAPIHTPAFVWVLGSEATWASSLMTAVQQAGYPGAAIASHHTLPTLEARPALSILVGCVTDQNWSWMQETIGAIAQMPAQTERLIFDFTQTQQVADLWGALDDVVMGGVSQSQIRAMSDGASFEGNVSTANSGGFASVRTRNFDPGLDLSGQTGIVLRVKGDGQRYKFMLRTSTAWDSLAYCYSFDTIANTWQTLHIPFAELRPVFRAKTVSNATPIHLGQIAAFQLMLSKFEYDGALNPHFQPGAFQLQVAAIASYCHSPQPQPPQHLFLAGESQNWEAIAQQLQTMGIPHTLYPHPADHPLDGTQLEGWVVRSLHDLSKA
jgi:hypothetical protein